MADIKLSVGDEVKYTMLHVGVVVFRVTAVDPKDADKITVQFLRTEDGR